MLVGTPTLPGFVPDLVEAGGETVTPTDEDKEYTVTFNVNNQPSANEQSAIVKYVDISDQNRVILQKEVHGQANLPISYDPESELKQLQAKGYVLVNNGFNKDGEVQFFGNADGYQPIFVMTMKGDAIAVNKEHPNKAVDPSLYTATSKLTVKFTGLEQDLEDNVQTAHWNRTVTFSPSAGKVIEHGRYDTPWAADIDRYQSIKVPKVMGYQAEADIVEAPPLSREDQVVTVKYTKGDSEPVQSSEPDEAEQVAIINFIDVDDHGRSITSSGLITGDPGENIKELYSTENPLNFLQKAGYHVVFNDFDRDGVEPRFNNNALLPQVFTIGVSKKGTTSTQDQIAQIKNSIASSKENKQDYSQALADLTNVVSSLYDLVQKQSN